MHSPPETVHSPSTRSPEMLHPGKGTKCTANPVCAPEENQEPESLRPGMCMKCRAHLGQYPCREPWSLSSIDLGSTCCLELCQTQCGPPTVSTPHTCQQYLFAMSLPPHKTTEQVSLNKWPPLTPVSGQRLHTEEICKQRKPK